MKQFTTKESVAIEVNRIKNRIASLNAKGVQNVNLVRKAERKLRQLEEIGKSL